MKPNILLITTDQQRYDTLPPYAPSFLRTPHLNYLMRSGVTFDRAYTCSPVCVAARASMLTGQNPRTHRILGNQETSRTIGREGTLPSVLRECGYQTAAIGKMHFGPERTRHGFDEMIIPSDYYLEMERSGNPLQPMRHGLGQNEIYPTMSTVPEAMTLTNWTADQSLKYIRERRDPGLPFFLWCSFSKPHPPFDPPEPYYSMYRNCEIAAPIYGDWSGESAPAPLKNWRESWSGDLIPPELIKEARSAYYGLITQIDYNMGRVFAALQDLNMLEDTLIVFTSDHGEYLGDHHCTGKFFFHEPSARVPFILRLPKDMRKGNAGKRSSDLVTHSDILPTLLAAAGGGAPKGVCDGENLIDLVNGKLEKKRVYIECGFGDVLCEKPHSLYLGICDGRYKYIWYPEGASEQLFDLQEDPHEINDRANSEELASVKARMKTELIKREKARGGLFLKDGELASVPLSAGTTEERRSVLWAGYHSEYYHIDVKH